MLALQLDPPPVNGTPYEFLVAALLWVGVIALVLLLGKTFDALMRWGESNVPPMPDAPDDDRRR
jgi:hypothetical protein